MTRKDPLRFWPTGRMYYEGDGIGPVVEVPIHTLRRWLRKARKIAPLFGHREAHAYIVAHVECESLAADIIRVLGKENGK
jgi:hypothetical protein